MTGAITSNTIFIAGDQNTIKNAKATNSFYFKAIARRMCVGHAASYPVKWSCKVEVFGAKIHPGQLVHADKHGFIVISEDEQEKLLEAVIFMDTNECNTMINAARFAFGKTTERILRSMDAASQEFDRNAQEKYGSRGEW